MRMMATWGIVVLDEVERDHAIGAEQPTPPLARRRI